MVSANWTMFPVFAYYTPAFKCTALPYQYCNEDPTCLDDLNARISPEQMDDTFNITTGGCQMGFISLDDFNTCMAPSGTWLCSFISHTGC